jgi:hypothetical protein
MSAQPTHEHDIHELDRGRSFWVVGSKDLVVVGHDEKSGDVLELAVDRSENAYDVFSHP